MGHKKRTICLLIFSMLIFFSACDSKGQVIVKVGDVGIQDKQLDQYAYLYCFIQGDDAESLTEENLEYLKTLLLEDLIALNVIRTYYKGDESVLPEDYKESVNEFLKTIKEQKPADNYMKKYGITKKALKDFYIDQFYSHAFLEELSADIPEVTDQEINEYYNNNVEKFKVDRVTAKHILVKEESLAEDILSRLKKGADFAEEAKMHSIDEGSSENGGDLDSFGRGDMIPEFEAAAFSLKPGELSDIVKTIYGYHIIYVSDKEQRVKAFEEVENDIRNMIENSYLLEAYTEKIGELKEEIGVEYLLE